MNANDIVIKIRELRLRNQYTQEYMAGKLAISQNAYSKMEIGSTRITLQRLFEIAEIFKIEVSALLTDD